MTLAKLSPAWYALHTRSRFENVVTEGLDKKKIEVFLPKISVRSKRLDRKKIIQVPLFPGYIFVKSDLSPAHHLEIVKTAGAVRLIGTVKGPVAIPEENIESLKIMVSSDQEIISGTRLEAGNRILVISGPFTGVTGTFVRYKSTDRVVVYIGALGQSAAVEVNEEDIQLLPEIK
ncbi:MAG: transcriptional antiterminator [Desulfobacteraceae bacterium IS3]|nr:MAG: transcriptional antiterminator [Desulfobacteraceae bacterium IS3]